VRRHLNTRSDDRQGDHQCSSPWHCPSRLPFLYYNEIKRRRGDEDSYRAGHPGRPLGDSRHTLSASHSLHFLTRPDSFAASLWRNNPPNTPISHTCEEQFPRMTCLPAMHLQRHLMKWNYHCQRHQPCLLPATIVPHAMLASLASVLSVVIILATP
jgi:hypothetical protein